MKRQVRQWLLIGMVITAGCDSSATTTELGPQVRTAGELRNALTEEAAHHIGPDGNLEIHLETNPSHISEADAVEQAVAYVRTIARGHRTLHELVHGAPMNFDRLLPDVRVYLAHTLYDEIEATAAPLHKALGPYYVVLFKDGNEDVLSVAVSAFNHDVTVGGEKLIMPRQSGSDFVASAVPRGVRLTLTPEESVIIASRAAGVQVRSVPVLIRNKFPGNSPASSLWKLQLAQPTEFVRGSDGTRVTLVDVFVDGRGVLHEGVRADRNLSLSAKYTRRGVATSVHHRLGVADFIPVSAAASR